MFKIITLLAALLLVASCFTILQRNKTLKQDWPFTKCGTGDWDIESVDITPKPAKGVTAAIDIVIIV